MSWLVWQFQDEFAAVAMLVGFIFAMLRGDAPERAMALAMLCQVPILLVEQMLFGWRDPATSYQQLELGMLVVDLVSLTLYAGIATRANRVYPLLIAGAQLVAVMGHVVRAMNDDLVPRAYATLVIAPTHFEIAVLIAGTFAHARRERRFGPYPSWRHPIAAPGKDADAQHAA